MFTENKHSSPSAHISSRVYRAQFECEFASVIHGISRALDISSNLAYLRTVVAARNGRYVVDVRRPINFWKFMPRLKLLFYAHFRHRLGFNNVFAPSLPHPRTAFN